MPPEGNGIGSILSRLGVTVRNLSLSSSNTVILSELFAILAERQDQGEIRKLLGETLLRILRADHYASYLWSDAAGHFTHRIAIHMSDANLSQYEEHYQYHDPITHRLRACTEPTLVTDILPQQDLMRTEFFNDFLRRDGLFWGVNLHVRVAGVGTGDLRIWRSRNRENFGAEDLAVLRFVAPAFRAALKRCLANAEAPEPEDRCSQVIPLETALTARELQVARLVVSGLSDKEVAQQLAISFATVRSHIKAMFRKLGVDSRMKLAARLG